MRNSFAIAVLTIWIKLLKTGECFQASNFMSVPRLQEVEAYSHSPESKNHHDQLIDRLADKLEFENIQVQNKEQLLSDYQPSACQLIQIVHILKHPGCQPKAIASFACLGSCPSYVRTSNSKFWQHERSCSCCQQTGSQEATFALDCPSLDPPYRKVKTYAPVECLCRSCTDLSKENIRPQELIEALANELADNNQRSLIEKSQTK